MSDPNVVEQPVDPSVADLAIYRKQAEPVETPEPDPGTIEPEAGTPEPEKPAEQAAKEPVHAEEQEPDPASEAGKELAKKRRTLQSRIDEVTRERLAAEARANELERRLREVEAGKAKPEEPAQPAVDPNDPEPTEEDYFAKHPDHNYGQFVSHQARWAARQERRALEAEQSQRARTEGAQRILTQFGERAAAYAETDPEFQEVAVPFLNNLRLGTPIGDVIADSEMGPQLAKHLAQHPEVEQRIASLHPLRQLVELGKIEGRLAVEAAAKAAPKETPEPVVSKAPAPIEPVKPSGGSGTGSGVPDPARMSSVAEWNKNRHKFG